MGPVRSSLDQSADDTLGAVVPNGSQAAGVGALVVGLGAVVVGEGDADVVDGLVKVGRGVGSAPLEQPARKVATATVAIGQNRPVRMPQRYTQKDFATDRQRTAHTPLGSVVAPVTGFASWSRAR